MYLVTIVPVVHDVRDAASLWIRRFVGDCRWYTADKNPTEDTSERQILDEYVIA